MFDAGSVIGKLKMDVKNFKSSLKESSASMKKGTKTMGKDVEKLDKKVKKSGQTWKKWGTAIKGAVIVAGVAALRSLTESYGKQELAEKRLEAIGKKVAKLRDEEVKSLKLYASELQKTGVIGDEVALQGISQLASFQLNAEQLKILTPAMLDLAVAEKGLNATSEDLQQTANKLGVAISTGLVGKLKLSGIVMSEADEAAFKLGNQQERVTLITKILDGNYKGLNESMANTSAGGIKQMQDSLGDLAEILGGVIAPVVVFFADIVKDLANTISEAMKGSSIDVGLLGVAMKEVFDFIESEIMPVARDIFETIQFWLEVFKLIWEENYLGIQEITKFFWDATKLIFSESLDILTSTLSLFFKLFRGDWKGAFLEAGNVFEAAMRIILGIGALFWTALGDAFGVGTDEMVDFWVQALFAMKDKTFSIFDSINQWVTDSINSMIGMINSLIDKINGVSGKVGISAIGRIDFLENTKLSDLVPTLDAVQPTSFGASAAASFVGGGVAGLGTNIIMNFNDAIVSKDAAKEMMEDAFNEMRPNLNF